jgi:hypothetical protein
MEIMARDLEMEGEHKLPHLPERMLMTAVLLRAAKDLRDPHFMDGPEGEELVEWVKEEHSGEGRGFTLIDLCLALDLDVETARSVLYDLKGRTVCSHRDRIKICVRVK